MLKNIVVLASGSGSNAEAIARYLGAGQIAGVTLIMSNRNDAYVLKRAETLNIPTFCFTRSELYESDIVLNRLSSENPTLIVLAGFLWLLPENIIKKFPNRIINIHPALLPKYGGKGMFGLKVHEAVIAANEIESGISIHYVNEKYDEGNVIFQAGCSVLPADTPETLASKIHELEHRHYPRVIESLLLRS